MDDTTTMSAPPREPRTGRPRGKRDTTPRRPALSRKGFDGLALLMRTASATGFTLAGGVQFDRSGRITVTLKANEPVAVPVEAAAEAGE